MAFAAARNAGSGAFRSTAGILPDATNRTSPERAHRRASGLEGVNAPNTCTSMASAKRSRPGPMSRKPRLSSFAVVVASSSVHRARSSTAIRIATKSNSSTLMRNSLSTPSHCFTCPGPHEDRTMALALLPMKLCSEPPLSGRTIVTDFWRHPKLIELFSRSSSKKYSGAAMRGLAQRRTPALHTPMPLATHVRVRKAKIAEDRAASMNVPSVRAPEIPFPLEILGDLKQNKNVVPKLYSGIFRNERRRRRRNLLPDDGMAGLPLFDAHRVVADSRRRWRAHPATSAW
eukprot:scaffold7254_cov115-Isochrysis_galbana.AAC.4